LDATLYWCVDAVLVEWWGIGISGVPWGGELVLVCQYAVGVAVAAVAIS
jgi:hypothetical protein